MLCQRWICKREWLWLSAQNGNSRFVSALHFSRWSIFEWVAHRPAFGPKWQLLICKLNSTLLFENFRFCPLPFESALALQLCPFPSSQPSINCPPFCSANFAATKCTTTHTPQYIQQFVHHLLQLLMCLIILFLFLKLFSTHYTPFFCSSLLYTSSSNVHTFFSLFFI
jgi:hypothetical protein